MLGQLQFVEFTLVKDVFLLKNDKNENRKQTKTKLKKLRVHYRHET